MEFYDELERDMTALSSPARLLSIEQAREAWWQFRTGNRLEEASRLWASFLNWQLIPENHGKLPWDFLTWWAMGESNPGALYNTLDRGRALASGYEGNLTELALRGRALRKGLARSETDPMTLPELEARLRRQILSESESAADALAGYQDRTRELLKAADPQAPTAPTEADALNLSALEVLAEQVPGVYRAAVQAVQTGDVGALHDLGTATKPPRYVEWGKQFGHDFTDGRLPERGQIYDAHHVPVGEGEARSQDRPHVLVFVDRPKHIPQPGGPITAHHRDFSPRNDAARLTALLYYNTVELARYEAWTRGEPDPWPELPAYALMRP